MLNPSKEQEEEWAEQKLLCFARFCWVNRHKVQTCRDNVQRTWAQIFLKNHGINLDVYAADRIRQGKSKSKVATPESVQRSLWEST